MFRRLPREDCYLITKAAYRDLTGAGEGLTVGALHRLSRLLRTLWVVLLGIAALVRIATSKKIAKELADSGYM